MNVAGMMMRKVSSVNEIILGRSPAKTRPIIPIRALKRLSRLGLIFTFGHMPLTSKVAATIWNITTAMALPPSMAMATKPRKPGANVAANAGMASSGWILGKMTLAAIPMKLPPVP